MPDITFEEDTPRKVSNAYSPTVDYLIEQLKAGTPKRATIPVADAEEKKRVLRQCQDYANSVGFSAGERQLDDDDPRNPEKVLLVGVRPKRERNKAAATTTPAAA